MVQFGIPLNQANAFSMLEYFVANGIVNDNDDLGLKFFTLDAFTEYDDSEKIDSSLIRLFAKHLSRNVSVQKEFNQDNITDPTHQKIIRVWKDGLKST